MKITSSKPTNRLVRIVVPVVIVAILLAIASFVYVYKFNGNIFGWTTEKNASQGKPAINLDKPTTDQKTAGDAIKKDAVNNTPSTPTPQNGTSKATVDVIITAASQNGSVLQLRTLISAVEGSGTCTLTLTRGGQTVTKKADIQALSSSSTCKGFDIPVSELSPGEWNATVLYDSSASTGSTSKTLTIQ